MNIAFVNATRLWAGVKVWMLEFAAELTGLGHHVVVYARDERMVEAARAAGVAAEHVPHFGADYSPLAVARFRRAFRRDGIDVAVMNIYKELRTAGIAARLLGIPVVHRVGLVGDIGNKWDRRLAHRRLVERILVTSEALRRDVVAAHPFIADADAVCVHNGRAVTGAPRAAPHRPLRFVITARIEAHKGHLHLLEALARLQGEGLDFRCAIHGEGGFRETVAARVAALGLGERVSLPGFAPDLSTALGDYDVGLLCSDYESLANTVLEYLAAGLPAVATDSGGVPEMLHEGHNGYLYRYGDVDALAALLARFVRMDDGEYARLSANAVGEIRERFDRRDKARELAAFLQGLVEARRAGRRG